ADGAYLERSRPLGVRGGPLDDDGLASSIAERIASAPGLSPSAGLELRVRRRVVELRGRAAGCGELADTASAALSVGGVRAGGLLAGCRWPGRPRRRARCITTGSMHSRAFRRRRFLNWFPLGLVYALFYMGRYNVSVAGAELSAKYKW